MQREYSDEFPTDHSSREEGKKEKKSFWERATKDRGAEKDRDKDKERTRDKERKEDEGQVEITRMIGACASSAMVAYTHPHWDYARQYR